MSQSRFIQELDRNFSVQAAAGTGKTRALVDRITQAARTRPEIISDFVVVTYTNRAADEMRQRLRESILQESKNADVIIQGLSRMFIGTIHGFCLGLIQQHGPLLGYPEQVQSVEEDDPHIYQRYRRTRMGATDSAARAALHRLLPARDLEHLAQKLQSFVVDWTEQLSVFPSSPTSQLSTLKLDPRALDGVVGRAGAGQVGVEYWQNFWRTWAEQWNQGVPFLDWPEYDKRGGEPMKQAWPQALQKISGIALREAWQACMAEAAAFQEYRLQQGQLYFSDQIVLARRLLRHPTVRRRLLLENRRILLDEAQDTDPYQFQLLVELARAPESEPFAWPGTGAAPRAGHFNMVGDQQQAIYRQRATLPLYQAYHEALVNSSAGEALTFRTTYRCRPAVVSWVNQQMEPVLDGRGGQASYVPLESAKSDDPGQVLYWRPPALEAKANAEKKMKSEAAWLARQLKEMGYQGLRAKNWNEVAVLCPVRRWLDIVGRALRQVGINSVLHFDQVNQERPEYLWLTALLTIHQEPNNEFEIIGILRELYGVSDAVIYARRWADGAEEPRSFALAEYPAPRDDCERLLSVWFRIRQEAEKLPLGEAVECWCERTDLAARLAALPEGAENVKGLHALQLEAHAAQARGTNLTEWAQKLREKLTTKKSRAVSPNGAAVQLITMQKSKGLEWDAVIIPFLGAQNSPGNRSDKIKILLPPRLPAQEPEPAEFCLGSDIDSTGWEEAQAREEAEAARERRRLYYVASTRARYSLVLLDDEELWGNTNAKKVWTLKGPNGYEGFQAVVEGQEGAELPFVNPLCPCPEVASALSSLTETSTVDAAVFDSLASWPPAISMPQAERAPASYEPQRSWLEVGADPALAYGVWWHDWVRQLPWGEGFEALQSAAEKSFLTLQGSFDLLRAREEATRFLATPLARSLATRESETVLWEIPYLTRDLSGEMVERRIDLLFREANGAWTLLDWKTDQLTSWEDLLKLHRRQLVDYAEGAQRAGLKVGSILLYSTAQAESREVGIDR